MKLIEAVRRYNEKKRKHQTEEIRKKIEPWKERYSRAQKGIKKNVNPSLFKPMGEPDLGLDLGGSGIGRMGSIADDVAGLDFGPEFDFSPGQSCRKHRKKKRGKK